MKTNNSKILIVVEDINIINDLKKLGVHNFVFPLRGLTVGIPNTFFVSEINEEGFIYINRILDNEGIDYLKSIKDSILDNEYIKGIIFDDLGVLEIFKDTNLEKILYLTHFNNNTSSVKVYLDYVDSVILSTDITREETKRIVSSIPNKVSLFTFGLVSGMYSRRKLIDNYASFYKISKQNPLVIENTNHEFILFENDYGTIIYNANYFDGLELLELDTLYNFYYPIFLSNEEILEVIKGNLEGINTDKGFLDKPTIFKLKGGSDQ